MARLRPHKSPADSFAEGLPPEQAAPEGLPPEQAAPEGLPPGQAAPEGLPETPIAGFVVASHEVLFTPVDVSLCDACGRPIEPSVDSDDRCSSGQGVYLWNRGGQTQLERVPLCAGCASAIGVTALARWEIEEEEG